MPILNANRKKINSIPGTLLYSGKYLNEPTTIELIQYDAEKIERFNIRSIDELKSSDSVQWINVVGLNNIPIIESIGERFNIHRIDLEDILDVSQRSKIEQKDNYLFSIFKMFFPESNDIIIEHVSIVMLDNLLITFQEKKDDVFDSIRTRLVSNQGRIRKMKVDYLFYSITDHLIDQYYKSIQRIEQRFLAVETSVIEQKNTNMDEVYQLRKDLLYLRNGISPIKDMIQDILIETNTFFSDAVKQYFIDTKDNVAQILETIGTHREMVNSLYETQVSNRNDEMNKTIMTLTIFSVIFIPLTFLAGIFGMNFKFIPLLESKYAFTIFAACCIVIVIAMIIFFKRKKWF